MSVSRRIDRWFGRMSPGVVAMQSGRGPSQDTGHKTASHKYIGEVVYGGLDGIITTFAVVSGVAGANLSSGIVLILGLANLLADGLSMGVGAYFSSKSDHEYYEAERARETQQVRANPKEERHELEEIYVGKGYSTQDAATLVEIQSKHEELFVDAMMIHELDMHPDDREPMVSGLTTFLAFQVAGAVPLMAYFSGRFFWPMPEATEFYWSVALTALALFSLGAAKVLVTTRHWFRSGLEMMLVGGLAAIVAYMVGFLLQGLQG